MSRLTLNGCVVSDDDQWLYDWFSIDAFSPAIVRGALDETPEGEELVLEINSGGGSVFAGFEMYSILKAAARKTVAHVQSIAASAASTMMSGCTRVLLSPVAQVMMHLPSNCVQGNQNDMERERRTLESITQSILNGYELRCGGKTDRARLVHMMQAETWLCAQDAIEIGLADGILFQDEGEGGVLPSNIVNSVGAGIRSLARHASAPVSTSALYAQYQQLVRSGAQPAQGHPVSPLIDNSEQNPPHSNAENQATPSQDVWQRQGRLAIENNRFF